MLPKMFRVFLKIWFIKKNLENEHQKLKLLKKKLAGIWELHYIREVHFGILVLTLHCYSGDKK